MNHETGESLCFQLWGCKLLVFAAFESTQRRQVAKANWASLRFLVCGLIAFAFCVEFDAYDICVGSDVER